MNDEGDRDKAPDQAPVEGDREEALNDPLHRAMETAHLLYQLDGLGFETDTGLVEGHVVVTGRRDQSGKEPAPASSELANLRAAIAALSSRAATQDLLSVDLTLPEDDYLIDDDTELAHDVAEQPHPGPTGAESADDPHVLDLTGEQVQDRLPATDWQHLPPDEKVRQSILVGLAVAFAGILLLQIGFAAFGGEVWERVGPALTTAGTLIGTGFGAAFGYYFAKK